MADSIPDQWAKLARYDFDTARAMLDTGRYLYVVFCCQQAVEKILKALIAQRTGECPPRLHNLIRLADHAGVELEQPQTVLMEDLSRYYVQTRYIEDISPLSRDLDQRTCKRLLDETEKALQWLSSML